MTSRKKAAEPSSELVDEKKSVSGQASEFFGQLKPYAGKLVDLYLRLSPHLEKLYAHALQGWAVGKPYYDKYYTEELGNVFFGLVMLLFGGNFALSISAYTALQVSSWHMIKESWQRLRVNYDSAMQAANEDLDARAALDQDGDGTVDVAEMASAASKFMKASGSEKLDTLSSLRAVAIAIDPNDVMSALVGIWTACVSVMAALRSTFAAAVSMGVSLGETLRVQGYQYVQPLIERQDKEMKVWAEFMYGFICKSIAVAAAIALARMVVAFHSAVKGGQVLATAAFQVLAKKGLLPPHLARAALEASSSPAQKALLQGNALFLALCYILAFYGFSTQMRAGFTLDTWYLRLLLFPFSFVEAILTWFAIY